MIHNGKAVQIAELWQRKFIAFLEDYSEPVRRDWQVSLSPIIVVQYQQGIPYEVVFNPGRKKRLEIQKNKEIKIPGIGESLLQYQLGKKNTVLFPQDYKPYYTLVNIFPLGEGHITFAYEKRNDLNATARRIKRVDLEKMLTFSDDTGSFLWHNMVGTGASQPYWEHGQAMPSVPPLRHAIKEQHTLHNDVWHMPDYPGSNILFCGEHKIDTTLEMTRILYEKDIKHTLSIDRGIFYVIPVKDEVAGASFSLNPQSKMGGYETSGRYVALDFNDFARFLVAEEIRELFIPLISTPEEGAPPPVTVRSILEKGLYPRKELDLLNYW